MSVKLSSHEAMRLMENLRAGNSVICPECKAGEIVTKFELNTAHHFHCNNCDFQINTD